MNMMVCSKHASLVKEWSLDGFPNFDDLRTSCLFGNCFLPFIFDSIISVVVTGIFLLMHSLIFILLFRSVLNVEVIANFWSSSVIFL